MRASIPASSIKLSSFCESNGTGWLELDFVLTAALVSLVIASTPEDRPRRFYLHHGKSLRQNFARPVCAGRKKGNGLASGMVRRTAVPLQETISNIIRRRRRMTGRRGSTDRILSRGKGYRTTWPIQTITDIRRAAGWYSNT